MRTTAAVLWACVVASGACAYDDLDVTDDEGGYEGLDDDIGSSEHEALVLNNGPLVPGNLPKLDLSVMNSIPFTDGVKVLGCSSTGVTCYKLHPNLTSLYNTYGNPLFDAIVMCGMRQSIIVKMPSGRLVQGSEMGKWATRSGLNPWWTAPPDLTTRQRVSACLAAKHNASFSGVSINLTHPGDLSKSKMYPEMTVAANLFKPSGRYVRMWAGSNQLGSRCDFWSPYASRRSCSNPNDTANCSYITQDYANDTTCDRSGVAWTNCVAQNGVHYYDTVSVYLDGGRDCEGPSKCDGEDCIGKK